MTNDIDILLARYFGGNASQNDLAILDKWISSSADNQLEFDRMTKLYELLGHSEVEIPTPNTQKAKVKFAEYIHKTPSKSISLQPKWILRVASVILVLIVSSAVVWNLYFSEKDVVLLSNSISIEKILPDSTTVQLAENSKITYSSDFAKKTKTVYLEGKAKFEVGNAGNGKLQVRSGELYIEDIGTIFEVSALKNSNIVAVKVLEGQVHMFTLNNKGILLDKNTTGYFNKTTNEFEISEPSIDRLNSGVTRVNFNGITLAEAFNIVGDAYSVKIEVDDKEILNHQITVKFEGEDLDMVLQVIAETLDLKVQKSNDGYLITSKTDNN